MKYYEFMNDLSTDDLFDGLLGYGMFSERLPPAFTSEDFLTYIKTATIVSCPPQRFVSFESTRSTYMTRHMGIPTPFAYYLLCKCLKDNWHKLKVFFHAKTSNQNHKVSKVHLRKMKNTKCIFRMNYSNWKVGDNPQVDLLLGNKWVVKTDISQCYPSIYTHAISWALVTKNRAKALKNDRKAWFNQIDFYVRNTTHNETHGIMIGPHTSSLLSEIVLCAVDKELSSKWNYVRAIDDYQCYVDSYEDGMQFLVDLGKRLKEYGLTLNSKKTIISKLPQQLDKEWVSEIRQLLALVKPVDENVLNYKKTEICLNRANELVKQNDDAAVYTYLLSTLRKWNLSDNAKALLVKMYLHWALIYPYLLPAISEHLFDTFFVNQEIKNNFINTLYKQSIQSNSNESLAFALYFSIKQDVQIQDIDIDMILSMGNSISLVLSYLYCQKNSMNSDANKLSTYAASLKDEDFEENWIFVYEVLTEAELENCYSDKKTYNSMINEWKKMKSQGITFLRN